MNVLIKGLKIPETGYIDVRIHCDETAVVATGWHPYIQEFKAVKVPTPHGRLIDAKSLEHDILEWMPHDPCGDQDRERPFETDICVSTMMTIEEQPTVIEAEDKDEQGIQSVADSEQ